MYRLASTLCILLVGVASVLSAPASDAAGLVARDNTGRATWFNPGLGNCGRVNTDNDFIVAISKALYDQDGGRDCGRFIQVTDPRNGRTVVVQVEDSCQGCGFFDIDLSPAAFRQLEPLDVGVIPGVTWRFL